MNRLPATKKQTQFKPCPELAEALSAAEGAVEWANFLKGQNCLPENLATPANRQWVQ